MLEKDFKKELKTAIKARDVERKNVIKMVLGEVSRLNKKKDQKVTEIEINKIITKLVKSELIVLEYSGIDETESEYIKILKSYLPKMMSEKEIKTWILDNIDFNAYTNKVQAMGFIMKNLSGKANGNIVKKVLKKINT